MRDRKTILAFCATVLSVALPRCLAQSFVLDGAVVGRIAIESPFIIGPSLGLSISDKQKDLLFSLRWSSARGTDNFSVNSYRAEDRVLRYGCSVARSIYRREKTTISIGLAIDRLDVVRSAAGIDLGWGEVYRATGIGIGAVGRASYDIGSVISLIATVEPSYWHYTKSKAENPTTNPLARGLTSSPNFLLGLGCAFLLGTGR